MFSLPRTDLGDSGTHVQTDGTAIVATDCKLRIRHTIAVIPVTEATTPCVHLWRCALPNPFPTATLEVLSMITDHFTEGK